MLKKQNENHGYFSKFHVFFLIRIFGCFSRGASEARNQISEKRSTNNARQNFTGLFFHNLFFHRFEIWWSSNSKIEINNHYLFINISTDNVRVM